MTDISTAIKELEGVNDDGLLRSLFLERHHSGPVSDDWVKGELDDKYGPEIDLKLALRIRDLLEIVWSGDYTTDWVSTQALNMSLCPIHFVDYAACFDDDDPECDQIRACFPSHDT